MSPIMGVRGVTEVTGVTGVTRVTGLTGLTGEKGKGEEGGGEGGEEIVADGQTGRESKALREVLKIYCLSPFWPVLAFFSFLELTKLFEVYF